MGTAFALFDTAVGTCATAWTETAIAGVQLPERDPAALRARMARRFPDARETAPRDHAQPAVDALVAMLRGEPMDLSFIRLDMATLGAFDRRVYDAARGIPTGATVTYGELAARLGTPRLARAVGQALGRNPFPIVVPCHRVLAANGRPGGFSAPGGLDTKRRLLAIEGVHLAPPALLP